MEILHQAIEEETRNWVEGFYFETNDRKQGWIVLPDCEEHPELSGNPVEDLTSTYAVDMDTVCVYTNKIDIHGTKIFQGDEILFNILKVPVRIRLFVEFIDGGFAVQIEGKELYLSDLNQIECTGRNIHDKTDTDVHGKS